MLTTCCTLFVALVASSCFYQLFQPVVVVDEDDSLPLLQTTLSSTANNNHDDEKGKEGSMTGNSCNDFGLSASDTTGIGIDDTLTSDPTHFNTGFSQSQLYSTQSTSTATHNSGTQEMSRRKPISSVSSN